MRTMTRKRKPASLDTPQDIRALRELLGLSIEQAAARIGINPRTWQSWEQPSQKRKPSPAHVKLIRLLEDGTI